MKGRVLALLLCTIASFTGIAQSAEKKALSQQTYRVLKAAQEVQGTGEAGKAIRDLNNLVLKLEQKPYEQAIVLQTISHMHIANEDYATAIPPLRRSIKFKALPAEPQRQAEYNLIRLYMATEGFAKAIDQLKLWLAQEEKPQVEAYVMLATAHLQLGQYQEAIEPLRLAIGMSKEPKESWYQSLLGAYSELKRYPQCVGLLQSMLRLFPDNQIYWRQLAGIQLLQKQYPDALATMELAHLRGHIGTEQEFLNLAQLYLYLNAPYKAARLIESEVGSGGLGKTEKNWEHADNAWLLARETKKSVLSLEKARAVSHNPGLGLRLAQLYIETGRWAEAGNTLNTIISDGRLNSTDTGQAWMLLGIVLHENRALDESRVAFEQATKYHKTASNARQWLAFLDQG